MSPKADDRQYPSWFPKRDNFVSSSTSYRSRPELHSFSRTALLWILLFLFALRVVGQAVQRWQPQAYLPRFEEFQGSGIPYPALLAIQLTILVVMGRICWRVQSGTMAPRFRAGAFLRAFGGVYLAGSLARIAIGLLVPEAPRWFTAGIPAFFHLVLATFVLVVAHCHLRGAKLTHTQR